MKYLVLLCDGMSDYPLKQLNGKTPMEVAKKTMMNSLSEKSIVGLVKTVPDNMKPGSDIANMSVMGFDPLKYYTGRSPLEALSLGLSLDDSDVTLRCNLVTLSDDANYEDKKMVDYCGGDISSEDAEILIEAINDAFKNDIFEFFNGVSYRHCLVWKNGTTDLSNMTPPHDISGKTIKEYLSENENAKPLIDMMKKSFSILDNHPINQKRAAEGKNKANSIWLWGEGKKTVLPDFENLYKMKSSVISAVDLLKGIAQGANMRHPDVENATGYIDTNFVGKAECALDELKNHSDYVYLHFEAPDECGHRGELENKIKSIEIIDKTVLTYLKENMDKIFEDYKIMILPDHPTPIEIKTHASDPVPYLIYQKSKNIKSNIKNFNESSAKTADNFVESGVDLMKKLLEED
ncbi:MAG: cofactor-independent phosphoglycerate mutase [Clostridia bacterium]|nr:cofactor-independent phosphoglycerate mutase [Clostridia bacterium]